mmetsp:Transcript_37880/g.79845  ORF Transcript_37880/g.79845 Transcript_37880/m.79845 type:complete len:86 (-) Transcript_37880:69-326(-)
MVLVYVIEKVGEMIGPVIGIEKNVVVVADCVAAHDDIADVAAVAAVGVVCCLMTAQVFLAGLIAGFGDDHLKKAQAWRTEVIGYH